MKKTRQTKRSNKITTNYDALEISGAPDEIILLAIVEMIMDRWKYLNKIYSENPKLKRNKKLETTFEEACWMVNTTLNSKYLLHGSIFVVLFSWISTPQGHEFWSIINKLYKIRK